MHDELCRRLMACKSTEALQWLLDHGREIEFTSQGQLCFLSPSHLQGCVSLWTGAEERRFSSGAQLVQDPDFLALWEGAVIETIF